MAHQAYDSDETVRSAQVQGMQAIIPRKANRKMQRPLNKERGKARHLVEKIFQRMKIFRRVATRFDKLDTRYLGLCTHRQRHKVASLNFPNTA
ncbi:MAG: transposase [Rhodoferax sp.]